MSVVRTGRSAAILLILLVLGAWHLAFPADARAQAAWLPVEGEGGVSVVFQSLDFGGHFDEHGTKLEGAVPSRAFVTIVEFEYGLSDKLAFTSRLPFIASKFTGDHHEPVTAFLLARYEEFRRMNPDAAVTNLDTGEYYATFQDFGFTLRYNVFDRGVVVTPVIGATIPSHNYRTVGEASPGQNRRALHAGVNVGGLLGPLLPRAYAHGRYTYSFVQSLAGVPLDRSNADFELGYALTPTVSIRGLTSWLRTHGGVPFSEAYESLELFLVHDRLLASRSWHVGGGATVSLTDSINIDGAVVTFLAGSDTHYGTGISVGLTWRFFRGGPPSALPSLALRRP
jgi:hypothetical protein